MRADRLTLDGQDLRLVDILAPTADDHPIALEAARYAAQVVSTSVHVVKIVLPPDRWGREVVQIRLGDEPGDAATLQERLVALGLARVAPESSEDAFIERLLHVETCARAAGVGLWSIPSFRPLKHDEAGRATGAFALIEGPVLRVGRAGGRIYLNFAEDYRTDFTGVATSGATRRWRAQGLDLLELAGRPVRLRGYVNQLNGPMIELRHRRQIELLDGPAPVCNEDAA